jgi:hypothetical protein
MNLKHLRAGLGIAAGLKKTLPFDIDEANVFSVPTTHTSWLIPIEDTSLFPVNDDVVHKTPTGDAFNIELYTWALHDHTSVRFGYDRDNKAIAYHDEVTS